MRRLREAIRLKREWNWFERINKELTFYKQIHLPFWSLQYIYEREKYSTVYYQDTLL